MASTALLRGRGPRAAAIGAAAATALAACSWRTIATACLSHKQTGRFSFIPFLSRLSERCVM
ncbi:uncharacterized protein PgNI_00920 [Pyricularia grisea]|uniref:Uncharacterized protein n=1 Tax=Pyricularia grisea TaxID=148305 RepID=A0A6P8BI03_PYRGI|nr:uncharacterized protein PgNI_00920 [Pyricularia grisea]TLD16340.1 hypothetical protein PgNI_00920 [Pyricularia grisea]